MAQTLPKAVIILPAFNEAGTIGNVVREIQSSAILPAPDILVIDDGSTDATAAEALAAGARVVRLVENLGYGYALKTGYQIAQEEGAGIVVQMDGDGQHAPGSIPALIAALVDGGYDVVIGSRALSDTPYAMPWARRIGQRFFSSILEGMAGLRIGDPTSGFQVLGPRALALFAANDFPGDYPDTNVLLYLALRGMRVCEAPAVFRPNARGASMHNGILKPAYYIYSMLLSMAMVYWRHWRDGHRGGPK